VKRNIRLDRFDNISLRGPRTQVREEEPKQKTPSTDPHHFPSQVQTSAYTPRSPYQHAGEGGRAPTPVPPSPLTR